MSSAEKNLNLTNAVVSAAAINATNALSGKEIVPLGGKGVPPLPPVYVSPWKTKPSPRNFCVIQTQINKWVEGLTRSLGFHGCFAVNNQGRSGGHICFHSKLSSRIILVF